MEKDQTKMDINSNTSSSNKDLEVQPEHLELKHHTNAEIEASGSWIDKQINILGAKFRFSSAMCQIVLLAFVVF